LHTAPAGIRRRWSVGRKEYNETRWKMKGARMSALNVADIIIEGVTLDLFSAHIKN
jgi:hypothetical protein